MFGFGGDELPFQIGAHIISGSTGGDRLAEDRTKGASEAIGGRMSPAQLDLAEHILQLGGSQFRDGAVADTGLRKVKQPGVFVMLAVERPSRSSFERFLADRLKRILRAGSDLALLLLVNSGVAPFRQGFSGGGAHGAGLGEGEVWVIPESPRSLLSLEPVLKSPKPFARWHHEQREPELIGQLVRLRARGQILVCVRCRY